MNDRITVGAESVDVRCAPSVGAYTDGGRPDNMQFPHLCTLSVFVGRRRRLEQGITVVHLVVMMCIAQVDRRFRNHDTVLAKYAIRRIIGHVASRQHTGGKPPVSIAAPLSSG